MHLLMNKYNNIIFIDYKIICKMYVHCTASWEVRVRPTYMNSSGGATECKAYRGCHKCAKPISHEAVIQSGSSGYFRHIGTKMGKTTTVF